MKKLSLVIISIVMFVLSSCIANPIDSIKRMTVSSPDQLDFTPQSLTWIQTGPNPDYWEIQIKTVTCGSPDLLKTFTCVEIPYTYVPNLVFPGDKTLYANVRAVIGNEKSDWSNTAKLKR